MWRSRHWAGALAATWLAALGGLAGCGGERSFSAQEFVEEMQAQGVEVHLDESLISTDESKELYAIELEPLPGAEPPAGAGKHADAGGSLSVHDDVAGANQRMESCQASADLLCYQASNIVIVLEGGGIEAQRLAVAIRNLSD